MEELRKLQKKIDELRNAQEEKPKGRKVPVMIEEVEESFKGFVLNQENRYFRLWREYLNSLDSTLERVLGFPSFSSPNFLLLWLLP